MGVENGSSRSKHSFSGQSRIRKVKVESKNIWGNPESAKHRKTKNPEERKNVVKISQESEMIEQALAKKKHKPILSKWI